jgi:hypothetical protein
MKSIKQIWDHTCDYILHKTIFRGKAGEVDFFGLQEEDAPVIDGTVIVLDMRLNKECAYSYRFENRYMLHMPIGNRVLAVFQALHSMDMIRPLAVVVNGQTYTPYGHYDSVPRRFRNLLTSAPV